MNNRDIKYYFLILLLLLVSIPLRIDAQNEVPKNSFAFHMGFGPLYGGGTGAAFSYCFPINEKYTLSTTVSSGITFALGFNELLSSVGYSVGMALEHTKNRRFILGACFGTLGVAAIDSLDETQRIRTGIGPSGYLGYKWIFENNLFGFIYLGLSGVVNVPEIENGSGPSFGMGIGYRFKQD
ncbi:MAG: hypothetical protein A2W95_08260 [Bacteroidetes bacterium GWA2_40_14]|nr:MAG: hypothetical protein A2W95_08260 [Bacteroidetes bacterium GWA2_40_14]